MPGEYPLGKPWKLVMDVSGKLLGDGGGTWRSCSMGAVDVLVEPREAVGELVMDGAETPWKSFWGWYEGTKPPS